MIFNFFKHRFGWSVYHIRVCHSKLYALCLVLNQQKSLFYSEWAFAMFGFLLEESGLNWSAELAYKQSLDLIESQMSACEDVSILMKKMEKAKQDYARILLYVDFFAHNIVICLI